MPLYAMKCPKCGHRFEILTSVERRDEIKCERCGERAERDYTGTCAFGAKGAGAGSSCSGSCGSCSGCHH